MPPKSQGTGKAPANRTVQPQTAGGLWVRSQGRAQPRGLYHAEGASRRLVSEVDSDQLGLECLRCRIVHKLEQMLLLLLLLLTPGANSEQRKLG